jgi:RND family efflux transporter MFP subunit
MTPLRHPDADPSASRPLDTVADPRILPMPAPIGSSPRPRGWVAGARRWLQRLVLMGALLTALAVLAMYFGGPAGEVDRPLTARTLRGQLRIEVTEKATLESANSVDGVCELSGSDNKIIMLVPEGSRVKKGQVVCRFDSTAIDNKIAEQRIKVKQALSKIETTRQEIAIATNKADSEISEAKVERTLATLDLEKYEKGDILVEIDDIKGNIADMSKRLEDAKIKLEQFRELVKKGFRSPDQLRGVEQEFLQYENFVARERRKLEVKEKYEKIRKVTEYSSKVEQAGAKLVRASANKIASLAKSNDEHQTAVATGEIEQAQLKVLTGEKDKTQIIAGQDGVLTYANEDWYDASRRIREGATVYSRQAIFSLPDLNRMQAKVSVHESLIKKIKAGQKADIKVDAVPGVPLTGEVIKVAQMADSNMSWRRGGVKEFPVVVKIDMKPGVELLPGMTAQVKIHVKEVADAVQVPIQAIAEEKGKTFVFKRTGSGYALTPVTVGESGTSMVQILSGLEAGEEVALDARRRLARTRPKDGTAETTDAVAKDVSPASADGKGAPATAPAGVSSDKPVTPASTPDPSADKVVEPPASTEKPAAAPAEKAAAQSAVKPVAEGVKTSAMFPSGATMGGPIKARPTRADIRPARLV